MCARSFLALSALIAVVAFGTPAAFGQRAAPGTADGAPGRPLVQPAAASAVILGRVVDAASGRPVAGALVTLGGTGSSPVAGAGGTVVPVAGPLAPGAAAGPLAMTDARGQFIFRDLPAGRYGLSVQAAGYIPGAYGQRRPEGSSRTIDLQENEATSNADVRLWRGGAISGTVTDEIGEPVVEVSVRALRRTMTRGRPRLVVAAQTITDDRGNYRLASLPPGEYLVTMPSSITTIPTVVAEAFTRGMASTDPASSRALVSELAATGAMSAVSGVAVGDQRVATGYGRALAPSPAETGRFAMYRTMFHPAAGSPAEATVISVGSGDERQNIDVQITLVSTFRVDGTVTGAAGAVGNVQVRLLPTFVDSLSSDAGFATTTTVTDSDGRFSLVGVPPGPYNVRVMLAPRPLLNFEAMALTGNSASGLPAGAQAALATEPSYSAEAAVSVVNRDVTGVALALTPGARISGSVEFVGTTAKPTPEELTRATVTLTRANGPALTGIPITRLDRNGRFTTPQYPPGSYVISISSPSGGWSLTSLRMAGREVVDRATDLSSDMQDVMATFTDRPIEIAGTVQRPGAKGDVLATVAIFPADHEGWIESGMVSRRARLVDTAASGAFTVTGLLPGDYLAAAVDLARPIDMQDPAHIAALARVGTRVTVALGDRRALALPVSQLR